MEKEIVALEKTIKVSNSIDGGKIKLKSSVNIEGKKDLLEKTKRRKELEKRKKRIIEISDPW